MAILAKKSGMMIGGRITFEDDHKWVFQPMDTKTPTTVYKKDLDKCIFDSDKAVDDAMKWINSRRKQLKKEKA